MYDFAKDDTSSQLQVYHVLIYLENARFWTSKTTQPFTSTSNYWEIENQTKSWNSKPHLQTNQINSVYSVSAISQKIVADLSHCVCGNSLFVSVTVLFVTFWCGHFRLSGNIKQIVRNNNRWHSQMNIVRVKKHESS